MPVVVVQVVAPASLEEGEEVFPFSARSVPLWLEGAGEEGLVWAPLFWVEAEPWAYRDRFFPEYAIHPVVHDGAREPDLPWLPKEVVGVLVWAPLLVLPVREEGAERGVVLLAWKARKRLE